MPLNSSKITSSIFEPVSVRAVVVVVSEESGSISVAVEGILKRHLTTETFERILRNELLQDQDEKQSRLKAIAQNMFTKDKNDGRN